MAEFRHQIEYLRNGIKDRLLPAIENKNEEVLQEQLKKFLEISDDILKETSPEIFTSKVKELEQFLSEFIPIRDKHGAISFDDERSADWHKAFSIFTVSSE